MSELKILVCDDDPDLQGLLVRRLDKMGVKPDVASDGRQALGFVEKHNYDVIVTDIYMPEATGLEVLQAAKHLDQDTQVVIITSSATLDNAIDALNHGAFGYLTKPFDHLIVFDNMVSRAIEYRHLLVAEKRKAEAQKRRGDMLEDEVAQRVQQLQKKQKGLLDLLGSLPDGILVVEEGGKVVLSSPVGERWLARDEKVEGQPIHSFIAQIHADMAEPSVQVKLADKELVLMSAEFPHDGESKRKAVIIREAEQSGVGAGSLVTDTVMGIKKGLATLYEQGLGTEIVLSLASQFAVLEQLAGWTGGTGGLKPSTPKQASPPPKAAAAPAPTPAPPVAKDPQPTTVSSVPPFMEPRKRVPTEELGEPRMNTAELAEALRSVGDSGDGEEQQAPAPPKAKMEDTQPAAKLKQSNVKQPAPAPTTEEPEPEPVADEPETAAVADEPEPAVAADEPELTAVAEELEPVAEELEPVPAAEEPEPVQVDQEPEPAPPAKPKSGLMARKAKVAAKAEAPPANAEPEPDLAVEEVDEPELPEPALSEADAEFPAARPTGDLDSAVFRPRVIPEEMNAKLETPTELPKANGKHGLLGRAKGPLKISSPVADTQMFRRVLAGLSGAEVEGLSGEKEAPPEIKPRPKAEKPQSKPAPKIEPEAQPQPEPEAEPELELDDLFPEDVMESEPQVEPEPVAVKARAGAWPPKLPSNDDDWDDSLEVSG